MQNKEQNIVKMYIVCSQMGRHGTLCYALEYKGHSKIFPVMRTGETTHNRSILLQVVRVLESLTFPCHLIVHAKGAIGGVKLNTNKNWVNRDMGNEILDAAEENGHTVEIVHTRPHNRLDYSKLLYLDKILREGNPAK